MRRSWRWSLAGFAAGGAAAVTVAAAGVVGAMGASAVPESERRHLREILHTPPVLVARGDTVQLRYDVVCATDELATPCSLAGRVHLRPAGSTGFTPVELTPAGPGSFTATPPAGLTRGGFDYYAVVETATGESLTLPAAGAASPHEAVAVQRWMEVDLDDHRFGAVRRPDRVAAAARWGDGLDELGLDSGPEQGRIGPSAFDVRSDGAVVVLDQVNDRLAVHEPGADAARVVPIDFAGGEGDLALDADGSAVVLDDGGSARAPVVSRIAPDGELVAAGSLGAPSGDMVRIGPGGPLVHAYPAEKWLPLGRGTQTLTPSAQRARARTERTAADGRGVLVRASQSEARFALVEGGRLVRSWLVRSETPLGEVQLAEPFGAGLLVVLRLWTETDAEFRVLELTPTGLGSTFSVERAEWAESAPLSRFRLVAGALYQLRSSPDGVDIVAFDVGGTR